MANNTWGKLDHGLDLLAIFDRLADGEDGERLRDAQIDCAVSEGAARADAAPKAERNIVRIGFWSVLMALFEVSKLATIEWKLGGTEST